MSKPTNVKKLFPLFLVVLLGASVVLLIRGCSSSRKDTDLITNLPERLPYQAWKEQTWQERLIKPEIRAELPDNNDKRFNFRLDGFNEFVDALSISEKAASTTDEELRLEYLELLFQQYYWAFKSMPVGSENAELVEPLLGGNSKFLLFISHESSLINSSGELLDSWGNPYHLHPETSQTIQIRSAGQDQRFWTADDLIIGQ